MLEPGRTLGRYRVDGTLGAGGMGAVYRAYDTVLRREVALKVLSGDSTEQARARLLREARAAAALKHPNAVAVFDVGEVDGTPFIAMEVVEGVPLRARLGDAALPFETKLRWLAAIADVLAAAHAAGIVHRDVKPENVMVCAGDAIKVLDFGIARRAGRAEAGGVEEPGPASFRTAEGAITGTPRYMAPEQRTGGEVDGRADQYAWALVACELLCGVHPRAVEHDELLSRTKDLPPLVLDTLVRALSGRPSDRFATMDEIVRRLSPIASPTPSSGAASAGATAEPTLDGAETIADEPVPAPKAGRTRLASLVLVALVLVGSALLIGARARPSQPAPTASAHVDAGEPPRIAVLPLDPAGTDAEHGYLADEVTEELIADLSRERQLRVLARASVMRYRGASTAVVARELGVARLVSGSLRVTGRELRVSLELVDAATQTAVWSRSYVRSIDELASVVREAARDLRRPLGVADGVAAKTTASPEAYASYLRGRYFWNQRSEAAVRKAIESFEAAITADPDYADAYVGLAEAYEVLPLVSAMTMSEAEPQARRALDKALALDPSSAGAHVANADAFEQFRWDFERAEVEYRRAIELDPASSLAHQWYGEMLATCARPDEAIAEMKRALEIDPVNLPLQRQFGMVLYVARRYPEALAQLRRTEEMDPNQPFLHHYLALTLAELGRYEDARREIPRVAVDWPPPIGAAMALTSEAYVAARTGRGDAAAKLVRDLEASGAPKTTPYLMSVAWALVGEREKAYVALERSVAERAPFTLNFNTSPAFDAYRGEARFEAIRRRAGLTK